MLIENFQNLSYNSWWVQDIEPSQDHLYTLDLSTKRFLQALNNCCENMQSTRTLPDSTTASAELTLFSTLFALGQQMWPPYMCGAKYGVQNSAAQRPSRHRTGTGNAHFNYYSPGKLYNQWCLIEYGYSLYCLLLSIINLPKTNWQTLSFDAFCPHLEQRSIIRWNT